MNNEEFSVKKRLKSFVYAFNGLKILLFEEHNSRIHLFAAILAVVLGWLLGITGMEWIALTLVIGAVFTAELFNSALENLADHISPDKNEKIKNAKDLAAAAVLISALTALAVGCVIFIPKISGLIACY